MPELERLLSILAVMVVAAPTILMIGIGGSVLIGRPPGEPAIARLIRLTVSVSLICAVSIFAAMLATGNRHVVLDLGDWVSIHAHDGDQNQVYHFRVKLIFDRLSIPFLVLSLILCGTIGAFAVKYLHRESGFYRFFVLYSMFTLGMVVESVAGTIETLFAGWELVGLSSALLVSFFHERPAPVRNGLRVWAIYRVSDAALVLAAVLIHQSLGSGDFEKLVGGEPWPDGRAGVRSGELVSIGLLIVLAAACKSALVPFSGWLPRAMEGPTPSSAVFYGALSVHLGAYLLLRVGPLLDESPALSATIVVLGLVTALYAYVTASVQTDIKSALSFASLAQVGIIIAEVGVGWRFIPLVHILGHGFLRTLQFLRAPTLLQDYRHLENALGERLPRGAGIGASVFAPHWRTWLYRFALERGYIESFLAEYVGRPFVKLFRWFDRQERGTIDAFASGEPDGNTENGSHPPDRP
jgi:NAD(P)H-quinone oxidoreductase subunit 5